MIGLPMHNGCGRSLSGNLLCKIVSLFLLTSLWCIPGCSTVSVHAVRRTVPENRKERTDGSAVIDRFGETRRIAAFAETCIATIWPAHHDALPDVVIRESVRLDRNRYRYSIVIEALYLSGSNNEAVQIVLTTESSRSIESFPYFSQMLQRTLKKLESEIHNVGRP
jgi:hypothetical protein